MARIRADLVGAVLVTLPGSSDPIALTAGQKVPEGIEVGDHVLEPSGSSEGTTTSTAEQAAEDAAAASKKAAKKDAKSAAKRAAKDAESTPASGEAGKSEDTASQLTPPPLNGAGSGAPAWREYAIKSTAAAGLSIEIPDDAKRSDIIDALHSAGIRTE